MEVTWCDTLFPIPKTLALLDWHCGEALWCHTLILAYTRYPLNRGPNG